MAGWCTWSRRNSAIARSLRIQLRDTYRALEDVADILTIDPQISLVLEELSVLSNRTSALVILGSSVSARNRLLHSLLGHRILADDLPRGLRWLRIRYGTVTQAHLVLGTSEFELVNELHCNKAPWDTLPLEDLLRKDASDLTTVLELELNNKFLKDGLQVVIPPDLDEADTNISHKELKEKYKDFYEKRELLLKKYNPVYLYAIDIIGSNIFREQFADCRMMSMRSEEDFWSHFSLYSMSNSWNVKDDEASDDVSKDLRVQTPKDGPYVFDGENCLDLHQLKQLNPSAQLLFVLLSDSPDIDEVKELKEQQTFLEEATESAKDMTEELPESDRTLYEEGVLRHTDITRIRQIQEMVVQRLYRRQIGRESKSQVTLDRRRYERLCSFMNELLEQWELMTNLPSKHSVKSQWTILNDAEVLSTTDQKGSSENNTTTSKKGGETFQVSGKKDDSKIVNNRTVLINKVAKFATDYMQYTLLEFATKLSEVHVKLVQQFILLSFDLARELQVVPKKVHFVAKQEQQLYEAITSKFTQGEKRQELLQIMSEVLQEMRAEVNCMDWSIDELPCHQDKEFMASNSMYYDAPMTPDNGVSLQLSTRQSGQQSGKSDDMLDDQSDVEEAVSYDDYNFEDYEIIQSADEGFGASVNDGTTQSTCGTQVGNIPVENESSIFSHSGTLTNKPLEGYDSCGSICAMISVKQATLDVQRTVLNNLSRKISLRLVEFVNCLKDSYFGTLQRCVVSLEGGGYSLSSSVSSLCGAPLALRVEPSDAFTLTGGVLHTLRRLLHRLITGGSSVRCPLSARWRRRTAAQALDELSEGRLTKIICNQILARLTTAHERYQSSLNALQTVLAARLHHSGDVKLAIRKKYAPNFARLCLESTSTCDLLMYGMPELGREIGRGQYGVVYAVRWAGRPCAAKSVLPADDRHYSDLAMEFYYMRSIPPHPRIVPLYGSVVSRGGGGASVLLVSARRPRDLHAAVCAGLPWQRRLRVALDIVEGIRYLHSLGLVHRDIKMKNVLLDSNDRGALTDLGFCAAEALMSGSVVGTPIHMAPEMFAGDYDAAVDVYAFGILFWYICSGDVKPPTAFDFQNKEQLWSKVKKGHRPERLPHFTDDCWEVMTSCWASEPSERALLGDIQPKLERILKKSIETENDDKVNRNRLSFNQNDDSLNLSAILLSLRSYELNCRK